MTEKEEKAYLKKLGERIYNARIKAGITSQECFAKMIGVNPKTFGKWETGQVAMKITDARRVAKGLSVSASWLLFGEGQMYEMVTERDCAKMLFLNLPTHFHCSWSINTGVGLGFYPIVDTPTLTYQLALPYELTNVQDVDSTALVRVKEEYQPFVECAENAKHLEDTRNYHSRLFHEDDYIPLLAAIPDTPLHHNPHRL